MNANLSECYAVADCLCEAALRKHPHNLDAAVGALLDADTGDTSGPVSIIVSFAWIPDRKRTTPRRLIPSVNHV
jgi:hypothetical protein